MVIFWKSQFWRFELICGKLKILQPLKDPQKVADIRGDRTFDVALCVLANHGPIVRKICIRTPAIFEKISLLGISLPFQ